MAEAKPPSTTDLLLLAAGLQLVKSPETNADFGEDYYLNEPTTTEERTLRESLPNPLWLRSPKAAWDSVKFRDWIIGTLAASVTGSKHDFTTISEPLIMSLDVLSKEFKRGMAGITNEIDELLTTANTHRDREFFSTLSVGMSRRKIDGKEVFTLGAGMRRRARVWLNSLEALQAEVEFFLPFFVIPSSSHPPDANFANARSICAGIKISKSNGAAIGRDENNKELVAMRFNLRIPFTTHWTSQKKSSPEDFVTRFGTPEIQFQKQVKDGATTRAWEKFDGWKDFLEKYVKLSEVSDLLNSPIGPLLIAKVSDPSGVTDIILKQKKRDEIKSDLKDAKRDLDDQLKLLKDIWTWTPPKRDAVGPHSTQRKLGSLLVALGFMSGKQGGGGEFEYAFKVGSGVTAWSVLDQLFGELDGFPLWVKGLTPKTDGEPRIALSLASQENLVDTRKKYFGLAGLAYNIPLTPVPEKSKEQDAKKEEDVKTPTIKLSKDNFTDDESILVPDEPEDGETSGEKKPSDAPKSTVEVLLHLGKWMSGETLDDNWFQRLLPPAEPPQQHRTPLPGIRLLPFKRMPDEKRPEAIFDWTLLIDLLSLGIDIKSTSKDGLVFLKGLAGHFGLGAVEIRLALKFSLEDIRNEKNFFERVAIGIGFKLKDLRLSFGPPEDEKKQEKSGNEIIDGLQELLADDWVAVPTPEKGPDPKLKTRLSAKKKDKFSISVGYLTPLKEGSHGTLDIQLYDEKGNRGKMALIPIDRFADPIYLRQIGIGLKGVENVELSKGLSDKAMLTISLTGGFRLPVFEMGFIGAKLSFPLNNPLDFKFGLDGLDVSLKIGDVIISGSFFKSGIEYAGSLTVDVPKASFSAMGFYGPIRVFDLSRDQEIINQLNLGKVHKKLQTKLTESKITPAAVNRVPAPGEWELVAADNTRYTITDDDDKVNLLRHEKTFFVFAMLNAAAGGGITAGPIQFTGIALGYGYNRRLKVPLIENVAEFPLVKMVMGEGGYQKDETELIKQLGKPLENPVSTLADMSEHLVAERGQQFACAGVRFTINGVIDCFALLVVQWGGGEFEISLLGLARFRHTRDASAKPICYVEMQILMSIKPSEGTFKLQALLTSNSWIINTDCKLTGGFALFVWFGGPHKGDAVLTLGGYHPRFQRPEHYPIVPRLGLNWPVNNSLSIKGGVYFAITPSCLMVGGKLEATFNSGRISAWFTVHLDVIINWFPVFFEVDIGISLRVEAAFFLTSLKVTIGASIKMCGPPVRGIAHIDLLVVSFDISFGPENPKEPELIGTWQQFCHKFLNLSGGDRRAVNAPVRAFPIVQPTLGAGRNNLNALPNDQRKDPKPKSEDAVWKVRADEVELSATAAVPVTNLKLGRTRTASASDGIQNLDLTGNPMMVTNPLVLESSGMQTKNSAGTFGAHPMGKKLESMLNVTVISDDASAPPPDLSHWTLEAEIGSLPEAVWNPEKPNLKPSEPTAKLIAGCITGIKRLKPPKGTLGKRSTPPKIEWHPLEPGKIWKSETAQESPSATRSRNIQPTLVQKQDEQKHIAAALKTAGFSLTWQPAQQVRFRELQADPLAGAVAA